MKRGCLIALAGVVGVLILCCVVYVVAGRVVDRTFKGGFKETMYDQTVFKLERGAGNPPQIDFTDSEMNAAFRSLPKLLGFGFDMCNSP